jgi:tetratricopeptide (TPR) repeat protein
MSSRPELKPIKIPAEPVYTLYDAGELEAAKQLALVALKTDPNNITLINVLAGCYYFLKEFDNAEKCMKILHSNIDDAGIDVNYAKVLYYLRRAPEAKEILVGALAKDPQKISDTDFALDYSLVCNAIGEFDESYELLQGLDPSDKRVQFNLGWHLLRYGKFSEGFEHLERGNELRVWGSENLYNLPVRKRVKQPSDVIGKRVLFACEGGQGDEVLFARFVQTIKTLGAAHVTVMCSPHLVTVFKTLPGADKVISFADYKLGLAPEYDVYVPAMSSVGLLQLNDPFTGIRFPYLQLDEEYCFPEADNMLPGINIGLRWQGNQEFEHDQFRSVPFQQLLKFRTLGNLYSLQRDSGLDEIKHNDPVIDLSEKMTTWERTLAYVNNLDYVVTSCTSMAHIAAAIGKQVCLLCPLVPYFPWAVPGETSDWYPNVRIFRQTVYNSWKEPIESCYNWIQQDITQKQEIAQ